MTLHIIFTYHLEMLLKSSNTGSFFFLNEQLTLLSDFLTH